MSHLQPALRVVAKSVAWLILLLVGLIASMLGGWVPPELAAMLGSRPRS